VQLKSEVLGSQLPVIGKWDHKKFYEFDELSWFLLLYKLIDTHQNPVAQSAMKVSLAAQVMSHTVAASLSTLAAGKEHSTAFNKFDTLLTRQWLVRIN
jgi:hypothetical protein